MSMYKDNSNHGKLNNNKILGFNLKKGEIRYSVLSGTLENPILISRDRRIVPQEPLPRLMDWFNSTFLEIIDSVTPSKLAYKLTLEPNKDQIRNSIYPYGILNHVAYSNQIDIYEYNTRNFVASKVGIKGKCDIYNLCDTIFGKNPPYWDKDQKYSILAAWLTLGKK